MTNMWGRMHRNPYREQISHAYATEAHAIGSSLLYGATDGTRDLRRWDGAERDAKKCSKTLPNREKNELERKLEKRKKEKKRTKKRKIRKNNDGNEERKNKVD